MAKRDWKFRVKCNAGVGETVCVVGNCEELGSWKNRNAVILTKEICSGEDDNIWSCVVSIPADDVEYRYFICVIIEPFGDMLERQSIVRQWETSFQPRTILRQGAENGMDFLTQPPLPPQQSYGSNCIDNPEPEEFGIHNNMSRVERGWLTSDTVLQLKLFDNPIQLWKKKLKGKKVSVKVTPVSINTSHVGIPTFMENSMDESVDTGDVTDKQQCWPIVEVVTLNEDSSGELKKQTQFGCLYNEGDFLMFQIHVTYLERVAYIVDFYTGVEEDVWPEEPASFHPPMSTELPEHVGSCHLLPAAMVESTGKVLVPITDRRHRPVGQLCLEYVVIRPVQSFECDMAASYARHWKHTWKGLDVGHRGAGVSFKTQTKQCAEVRENTIASLLRAARHGADMVELDVQLSKDLVPVIYHDFNVCIAIRKRKSSQRDVELEKGGPLSDGEHDCLVLPVKDLTLEQLHMLKGYNFPQLSNVLQFFDLDMEYPDGVYHLEEGTSKQERFTDEDLADHSPFPTLQHALEVVDPHVGFNVEIKWTMQLKDGTYELYHPFDLNLYVDLILETTLKHGGHRKIVFSCFNPDICSMIRLKQNKYPVLFLTQGITSKYPEYHDPRTQSIPKAVRYAVSAGILGINVHTEDILRDSSQVSLARDAGLVIFCWGDDNNDAATIRHLKELGLDGIIYDKIDYLADKKESIFLVEAREKEDAMLRQVSLDKFVQPVGVVGHTQFLTKLDS
ncbi:glycerophosphocholine phosphodiesterase GPCPD1-like isoform X1 [Ischnura elegans]|uniref:glycerophosphocholine phosphodiesterase GPCPD1-like isoform X1 n=1 Tax=Ischnura elegans TaxID=197161 RepID=UPI001ED89DF7|nr:glycerophosphocholine phosphodiesterase GPCPD1-like isoform X1 [Ischnura elegans]